MRGLLLPAWDRLGSFLSAGQRSVAWSGPLGQLIEVCWPGASFCEVTIWDSRSFCAGWPLNSLFAWNSTDSIHSAVFLDQFLAVSSPFLLQFFLTSWRATSLSKSYLIYQGLPGFHNTSRLKHPSSDLMCAITSVLLIYMHNFLLICQTYPLCTHRVAIFDAHPSSQVAPPPVTIRPKRYTCISGM